ncbi:MAG: HNH endonuclease [Nannocystaceae bacterium]|nr:HNH endonuclease [Nannocystaceae bacterium]
MRDTLLLDQGYQPLKVIAWQRAVVLHLVGKVELLSAHTWEIRTVANAFPAPSVVRLTRSLRHRQPFVRFSRENVYLRDGYQCQYCGKHCAGTELTLDHVQPSSRGGGTSWRNVVTACVRCNRDKGRLTPAEASMPLRSVPRRPKWLAPKILRVGAQQMPESWQIFLH